MRCPAESSRVLVLLAQCEVHTAEECVLVQCGYCNIKSKFMDEIVLA